MPEKELRLWETAESSAYLEQFRSLEPSGFAQYKIGGELIHNRIQLGLMAANLAILGSLGLYPVVVHGGSTQIELGLKELDIETAKPDGVRITPPEVASTIAGILGNVNDDLTAAINLGGVTAKGLKTGVFSGKLGSHEDFGSVEPESVEVSIDPVLEIIEDKLIPVLSCAGSLATENGVDSSTAININADIASTASAAVFKPRKLITLTAPGAVLNISGEPLDKLTASQAMELLDEGVINGGMAVKVRQLLALLELGVHDIVVTSPKAMLTELFTDRGSGTIISQG